MRGDCRGVSALVGYLLLFATVLSGTLLLSTAGLTLLLDSGSGGQQVIAESNLAVIDDGVQAVSGQAPATRVRLEPHDATLIYGPRYEVTVSVSGDGVELTGSDAIEASGRVLRYELTANRQLDYVSGLLAGKQEDGKRAVLYDPPAFRTSESRVVLPLPMVGQQRGTPTLVGRTGGSPVTVGLEQQSTRLVKRIATAPEGRMGRMRGTITVSGSGTAGAWKAFFEDRERFTRTDIDGDGSREFVADTDGDGTLDTAGASFRTRRLYVRTVAIGVDLDAAP